MGRGSGDVNATCDGQPRRAGPIGRILRTAVGVLLIVSIAGYYVDGPIQFVWRSVAVCVALVLVYILLHRVVPLLPGNRAARSLLPFIALVPLIAVYMLGAGGGPILGSGEGQLGTLTFLGISLVIAGLRGDSGCEVMAVPNAILRGDCHVGCPVFSPIDRIEKRLLDRTRNP